MLNRGSAHIVHNLKAKIQHVRKPLELEQVLSATVEDLVEEVVKPTFEFRSRFEWCVCMAFN